MKINSTTVQSNPMQHRTAAQERKVNKQVKALQKEIADLEKFETTTKKDMQDRMKFMSGRNACRHDDTLDAIDVKKQALRKKIADLQDC